MYSETYATAKYLWWIGVFVAVLGLGWSVSSDRAATLAAPELTQSSVVTPEWKTERLAGDGETATLSASALSPIYPATPGKELLGKTPPPVRVVGAHRPAAKVAAIVKKKQPTENPARAKVQEAVETHRMPRQFFAARAADDDARQSYGYAPEATLNAPQPRTPLNLVHGIY